MEPRPGFLARLSVAFSAFFAALFDGLVAMRVRRALAGELPAPEPVRAPEPPAPAEPDPRLALRLLATLQREGRLVDFLREDIASYSDADVGAAVRSVHAGCRRALDAAIPVAPIRTEADGATLTIDAGFDPSAIRLTGNVVGDPPFRGALRHHGWRATAVTIALGAAGQDPHVIAPAEVELP